MPQFMKIRRQKKSEKSDLLSYMISQKYFMYTLHLICGYIWVMPQSLLSCNFNQWEPFKDKLLGISSHFDLVLIYSRTDHAIADIYNTYICPLYTFKILTFLQGHGWPTTVDMSAFF